MTVAQIQTSPTDLDMIDKINEIIRNLLYVDDSTIKISGGVISAAPPIGTVYVQFPGKSAPADLYGGEWTNISSQFAGMFFRAEGGNSAAFGSTQNSGAPNVYGDFTITRSIDTLAWNIGQANGAFSKGSYTNTVGLNNYSVATQGNPYVIFNLSSGNSIYTADEVRPYNSTIRIWEKTG